MITSLIDCCTTGCADDLWDRFLEQVPSSHYEQTSRWASVKSAEGWKCSRIRVSVSGALVAGAQILYKDYGHAGRIGYVQNGPVLAGAGAAAKDRILQDISDVSRRLKCTYTAVRPPYTADIGVDLENRGYIRNPGVLPPLHLTDATLMLDLSKGTDSLMMEMRRTTRQQIRTSLKAGLEFSEGFREEIPVLFDLMAATCERRGEVPIPPSSGHFENIWDHFHTEGWCRIFLVRKDAGIVCCGFVFTFGDTVRFWKYGWSGEYASVCPNYFLYWKLIEWAQRNGFRHFDIMQVDPGIARALKENTPITPELASNRIYGPTLFKIGFGGNIVEYPGTYYRFRNPLLRRVIPAALRSPLVRNWAGRAVRKIQG